MRPVTSGFLTTTRATLRAGGRPTTGASTRASRAPAAAASPARRAPTRARRAAAAVAAGAPTEEFVEFVDTPEPEVVSDGRRTIRINGRPGEVSQIAPFTSTARRR